jgi:hypothetical protein
MRGKSESRDGLKKYVGKDVVVQFWVENHGSKRDGSPVRCIRDVQVLSHDSDGKVVYDKVADHVWQQDPDQVIVSSPYGSVVRSIVRVDSYVHKNGVPGYSVYNPRKSRVVKQ